MAESHERLPCAAVCRQRGAEATGGRGLLLVEVLAAAWGWYPEGVGKVVWFEFPEDCEAPCPTYGWGTALSLTAMREAA